MSEKEQSETAQSPVLSPRKKQLADKMSVILQERQQEEVKA